MKIIDWLGYNEDTSQYLLKPGELRSLRNLQPRRMGMLLSRPGTKKIYGKYDDEAILSIYRRETAFGEPDDYLWLQKGLVERDLTQEQILNLEVPEEEYWFLRRVLGNQERVIDQLKIAPNGTKIEGVSIAEDRHGRMFLFYGHGVKPRIYRPGDLANIAFEMGMAAPKSAPAISTSGTGYYIDSVDILSFGGAYWGPPSITADGGDPERDPKFRGIVSKGNLTGVEVLDGGRNFTKAPTIKIANDTVGSGFRGVGNIEADPGVEGFEDSMPATVTGTAPSESETYGETNGVEGNRILFLTSPDTAHTNTVDMPATSTDQLKLESVAGISVGDVVSLSGSPSIFATEDVIRVKSIDYSTKTVTLSKLWTPELDKSYKAQFRKDSSVGYADAEWNGKTKQFTARVPLRTSKGSGRGAEATLTLTPKPYSFGIGSFTVPEGGSFTVPIGGPETSKFAFTSVGWDNYLYDDYWAGARFDDVNSAENKTYGGVQASGSTFAYGFSGNIPAPSRRGSSSRRADVYFPDYSAVSVWLNTGARTGDIGQWSRFDAVVVRNGENDSNPHIDVELRPTSAARVSNKTGKTSYSTAVQGAANSPEFRYPKVRVYLKACPDSWVTDINYGGQFNLPSHVKEGQVDRERLAWWHRSAVSPRPIVDVQGSAERLDWGTVEVLDEGAGWAKNTQFAMRIYQANAYAQISDYNTGVREEKIGAAHQPFSYGSRYVEFEFRATAADDFTPEGPPNALDGDQYIDVVGVDFRAGDKAEVTLLKRNVESAERATAAIFDAVITSDGSGTEYSSGGAVLYRTSGSTVGVQAGDILTCETEGVLLTDSQVLSVATPTDIGPQLITLEKALAPDAVADAAQLSGYATRDEAGELWLQFGTLENQFLTAGVRMWETVGGSSHLISESKVVGSDTLVKVGGDLASGQYDFRPAFRFTSSTGLSKAQTLSWSATSLVDPPTPAENKVTSVRVISKGRNYFSPPTVQVRGGGTGYGLTVTPNIEDGKIVSVDIVDPGRNYSAKPELFTSAAPAKATANMQPTMLGTYRCAYRYADRSEQVIYEGDITTVDGDTPTLITLPDTTDIKFDQVVESPLFENNTRIISVSGNEVELNQPASASGPLEVIVIENQGVGYADGEIATCTVPNDPTVKIAVTMGKVLGINEFYVAAAEVVDPGTLLYGTGRTELQFSAPAAGGNAAKGYAKIRTLDPKPAYQAVIDRLQADRAAAEEVLAATRLRIADLEEQLFDTQVAIGIANQGSDNDLIRQLAATIGSLLLKIRNEGSQESDDLQAVADIDASIAEVQGRIDRAAALDHSITIRDLKKPAAYSDFSPIVDVDAGDNSAKMEWTLPGAEPPPRADMVEFWRTTSEQSLVFYRIESYGKPTSSGVEIVGEDTLSDEELMDPERANYAALPVVLPNGDVNAYRFGQPRDDMAVAVAFQDRLWMGVSTSAENGNTVFYSEFDEFESCPDVNDISIQINQKYPDRITALVPFGSMLLLMQNSHTYALQYNTAPNVDATIQMMSHRGVLHQRAWDIHENILYAVDESGIYAMARDGEVRPLSAAIKEFFVSESIDFSKRERFFLAVDPRTHILRFFCTLKSVGTDTPDFALCYDIEKGKWWTEHWPNSFCSAVTGRPDDARISTLVFGAVDGNMYELTGHSDHSNRGLTTVEVRDGGDGYTTAPKVRVPNCPGAQARAVVSEGRIVDALVYAPGWDGTWGLQLLTEDGKYLSDPFDRYMQGAEYAPIELEFDPPRPGGREADVRINYAEWKRRNPRSTVAEGESFVRVYGPILDPVTRPDPPLFLTEAGDPFWTEDGRQLQVEYYPVQIGDEAIGDFLPLRCYVSRIDGQDIYLSHPDGTPVSILGGEPRRSDDGDAYLEAGGTEATIYFYTPFKSAVPFRLATGFMQLANEEKVKGGDGLFDRSITLLYTPTETRKEVEVIRYFNGSESARANVARRQRGGPGGFLQDDDSASSLLDMSEDASSLAKSTGVAKANFASRMYTDNTGEDQYVQVEVLGRPHPDNGWGDMIGQQFVMHALTVDGIVDNAE